MSGAGEEQSTGADRAGSEARAPFAASRAGGRAGSGAANPADGSEKATGPSFIDALQPQGAFSGHRHSAREGQQRQSGRPSQGWAAGNEAATAEARNRIADKAPARRRRGASLEPKRGETFIPLQQRGACATRTT